MQATKLLALLKSLEKSEFRRFYKFVQSPYFNANQYVVGLYEYLRPYYPEFTSAKLEKEKVFAHLFPGETYMDTKMRNLISDLKQVVEEYLVVLELKMDKFRKRKILKDAYNRKNLYDFFLKATEELMTELEKNSMRDMDYFLDMLYLNYYLFFNPNTAKFTLANESLRAVIENLDRYYMLGKLRFNLEVSTRKKFLAEKIDGLLMEEVKALIQEDQADSFGQLPLLYQRVGQLQEEGRDDHLFAATVVQFKDHLGLLSLEEQRIILQNLLNHCIQVYNTGVFEYVQKQFDLYKMGLEQQILIYNNRITDASFSNIVAISSALKEFAWAERFINDYQPFLEEKTGVFTKGISLAYLNYNQKKYAEAIQVLQNIQFSLPSYELRARGLLLRIYYELFAKEDHYYELLASHLDAFRKYISRNKAISPQTLGAYKNLIVLVGKLLQCQVEKFGDKKLLTALKKEVEKSRPLILKKWLLEQITHQLRPPYQ